MRRWTILASTSIILAAASLMPSRALAQDHRLSFTGYLGGAGYSNLAGELDPGMMLESSGFYGGMAELWFGRLGVRLHAGVGNPGLESDPATAFGIAAADIDLVARFRRPRAGLFFQPYGVIGVGALRYDLSPDANVVGGFDYDADPSTRGTLVLGIGTDLGRGPVAVRLEMMDLIGWSSPLSRADGSHFEPVSHVVFTFGLSLRAGTIHLPPPPEPSRPPVTRTQPEQPRQPTRTEPAPEPEPRDTLRHVPRVPDGPVRTPGSPSDTATVDTTKMAPQAPDTTRTTPAPRDTTRERRRRPIPPDTVARPPVVPVDTAPTPPDTTSPPPPTEPTDTADAGDLVRGQLFTVRVTWAEADTEEEAAMAALAGALEAAGVPLWPSEPDLDAARVHRRIAALRNAADARILGNHIQQEYGLGWEWVHIDRDEDVSGTAVEASTAFVDGLREQGQSPGSPGSQPRGGAPPK